VHAGFLLLAAAARFANAQQTTNTSSAVAPFFILEHAEEVAGIGASLVWFESPSGRWMPHTLHPC